MSRPKNNSCLPMTFMRNLVVQARSLAGKSDAKHQERQSIRFSPTDQDAVVGVLGPSFAGQLPVRRAITQPAARQGWGFFLVPLIRLYVLGPYQNQGRLMTPARNARSMPAAEPRRRRSKLLGWGCLPTAVAASLLSDAERRGERGVMRFPSLPRLSCFSFHPHTSAVPVTI